MKIDSPSSITSCEASIRLEWISTRILPGVAVLLLSVPLCQWADSNLPDGIVPVYVIYMMIVIVLWSMYMVVQYAFVGIAQTRKAKDEASINNNNSHEEDVQTPVFLLEAKPFSNEPEDINPVGCVETFSNNITETEVTEEVAVTDNKVISEEALIPTMSHPLFRRLPPVQPTSRVLMTFTKVRLKARRRNWTLFMNTFYTSCLLLSMRKTWTISVQTF